MPQKNDPLPRQPSLMSGTEVKDEMDEMDYDEDDETEEEEALDEAEEDVKSMGSRMEKLFEISRRPLQGEISLVHCLFFETLFTRNSISELARGFVVLGFQCLLCISVLHLKFYTS